MFQIKIYRKCLENMLIFIRTILLVPRMPISIPTDSLIFCLILTLFHVVALQLLPKFHLGTKKKQRMSSLGLPFTKRVQLVYFQIMKIVSYNTFLDFSLFQELFVEGREAVLQIL